MRSSKWHALGNAYLLVEQAELTPESARELVGDADGTVEVLSAGVDEADVRIWNPDGSTAEMSGNATRIAARWLASRTGAQTVRLRVAEREVTARLLPDGDVEQEMGEVTVGAQEEVAGLEVIPVSVGNPHAVIRHEPARTELLRLGPLVETHPRFPERTNVQLVRVDSRSEATVAVWERGVGETLSSGTSACAVAGAAVANGWCASPVTVHLPGGDLLVEIDQRSRARLTGPAQEICHGEIATELLEEVKGG